MGASTGAGAKPELWLSRSERWLPVSRDGGRLMRLLHLSNDLYPAVTGGTELFVHQLLQAQKQLLRGVPIVWAAHGANSNLVAHQHLLSPVTSGSRCEQVGAEVAAIPDFVQLLSAFRPTVLHLHSFSERCGLSHVRAARAAGVRVVVTVHAPGFSCIKGNLIDASGAVCDGLLRQRRCTRCRLQNGGLPRWLAALVALQSGWPLTAEAPGRLAHLLTARQLTGDFHAAWLELTRLADAIHVLAAWSRDLLLRQGVPAQKIHLIRSAGPAPLPPRTRAPMEDGMLRLVAWGRCHPVKGFHLLVQAIQALPANVPAILHFYGPGWDEAYGQQLRRQIGHDPRFAVLGTLPPEQLLPRLQQYDLAAVPSTWLETGPLTVLEALAAHLPVAGTDRGGIRELLAGVPGCTLLPPTAQAWSSYLQGLLRNPHQLRALPSDMAVRGFSQIAAELSPLYGWPT
jgi:glycosyltransferase involved in cell wall biosynthesis